MAVISDGMNFAPKGKPNMVVGKGEFCFSAIALDHGHIYGMCNGLTEAGAQLKSVYDPDPKKVDDFCKAYPNVKRAASEEEILADPEIWLVASAAVTSERCALGLRVISTAHRSDIPFSILVETGAGNDICITQPH